MMCKRLRKPGKPASRRAASDEQVLEHAIAGNRVMLTLNRRHFIRLHLERPRHAGIVVCTFDPDFLALAKRIDAAVATALPMEGQLLRVSRPG